MLVRDATSHLTRELTPEVKRILDDFGVREYSPDRVMEAAEGIATVVVALLVDSSRPWVRELRENLNS